MRLGAENLAELGFKIPYMLVKGKLENVLPELLTDNSVDGCVSDPPYSLGFMGKAWDKHKTPLDFQLWFQDKAQHVYRVLKPGAYFVCFGGTRTFHRMTSAIEDAGFEIRDCIGWLYGSGFPKSHNGAWGGTALKPIIVARKPIEGTLKDNFEKWGTGGMDIDAGRIAGEPWKWGTQTDISGGGFGTKRPSDGYYHAKNVVGGENGRWPANIVHDGSEEVLEVFPFSKGQQGDVRGTEKSKPGDDDQGSAARFFYCAKASREDRNEGLEDFSKKPLLWSSGTKNPGSFQAEGTDRSSQNNHPTVKPTDLMRWLVRLFVPKNGICLDPFNGSGSTGKACMYENLKYIGVEMEFDLEISKARLDFAITNRSNQIGIFE